MPVFLAVPAFLSRRIQMLMPSGDVNQLLVFVQAVGNQALFGVKACPLQEGLGLETASWPAGLFPWVSRRSCPLPSMLSGSLLSHRFSRGLGHRLGSILSLLRPLGPPRALGAQVSARLT